MTERYQAFIVILDHDIREDDAQAIISAIKQMRNVASVTPKVQEIDSLIAIERAKAELRAKLWEVLR